MNWINFIFQDYYYDEDSKIKKALKIARAIISINKVGKINIWLRCDCLFSNYNARLIQLIGRFIHNYILRVYSTEISPLSNIGRYLSLPHPIGIVVGTDVIIGNNVTIYQNVTIGTNSCDTKDYPTIGSNVIIYANSMVIGKINVADNTILGGLSLLNKSTNKNGIYYGIPAKENERKDNSEAI